MKKIFGTKLKKEKKREEKKEEKKEEEKKEGQITPDNRVRCIDCANRTKLFYDLSANVQDEGDEENLEGYDLGEGRDPIRCIICRKFPKFRDNEPIQCEDCETNATIFYWTGPLNDVILCNECYQSEKTHGNKYVNDESGEEQASESL